MKNSFLTKEQIDNLVISANSIINSDDLSRLRKIGTKHNISLTHLSHTNCQLFWKIQYDAMDALPINDAFRKELTSEANWHIRHNSSEYLIRFIKYKDLWEDYCFLRSPKWEQFEHFATFTLGLYGVPTEGNIVPLILSGGDYFKYFSQWGKSNADKSALKESKSLMDQLDSMFAGKDVTERHIIANVILQYAISDKPMSFDEFHNILNKGK